MAYNMGMALLLTVCVVGFLLVLNEAIVRKLSEPNELSRKFIHITVGCFVAFWPFFLSWTEIILLSVAFVVGVGISKHFHIFKAIHSVQRPTYGELLFGAAVGITAVVTHGKGIYAAALLQMSLADGLAAIVGMRYGLTSRYKVFGATKSVVGTLTFFAISLALLVGFSEVTGAHLPLAFMLALAATASLIENIGVYGLDNIMVPVLFAVVLQYLA